MLLKLVMQITTTYTVPLGTMSLVVLVQNSVVDININTVVILVMELQQTKVTEDGIIL